jgi:hypothetical protein
MKLKGREVEEKVDATRRRRLSWQRPGGESVRRRAACLDTMLTKSRESAGGGSEGLHHHDHVIRVMKRGV